MTIEQAQLRIRVIGYIILVLSCLMFLAASAAMINGDGDTDFGLYSAIEYSLAAPVSIITAIAIINYSRLAGIVLVVLYLSDIPAYLDGGFTPLLLVHIPIRILIVVSLLPALFAYHRHIKGAGMRLGGIAALRWLFVAVVALATPFLTLGVASIYFGTYTAVTNGKDVRPSHMAWIKKNNLLVEDERLLEFYSTGMFDIRGNGNALTSTHVGVWWQDDGALYDAWILHSEVCEISEYYAGDYFTPAQYIVTGPGEDNWVALTLSVENNGHRRFMQKLKYFAVNLGGEGDDNPCATPDRADEQHQRRTRRRFARRRVLSLKPTQAQFLYMPQPGLSPRRPSGRTWPVLRR